MPKSVDDMAAAIIANMKEKTGKTIAQWLKIVAKTKLSKHNEIIKHLKSEYDMTHGYANMVAMKARESDQPVSGDDLIAVQYAGAKQELRPIYDAITKAVEKFGKDVEIAPKKAYVSLRRSKQFAIVQPSTKTRVDVGLILKEVDPDGRLEASGSFNAMVSHRVRLANVADVDRQLIGWLRQAYELA